MIDNRIALRNKEGFEAARQLILNDGGRNLTNDIRQVTLEMEAEERSLLDKRNKKQKSLRKKQLIPLVLVYLRLLYY